MCLNCVLDLISFLSSLCGICVRDRSESACALLFAAVRLAKSCSWHEGGGSGIVSNITDIVDSAEVKSAVDDAVVAAVILE